MAAAIGRSSQGLHEEPGAEIALEMTSKPAAIDKDDRAGSGRGLLETAQAGEEVSLGSWFIGGGPADEVTVKTPVSASLLRIAETNILHAQVAPRA